MVKRRGRRKTVCDRGADPAASCGRSASPLAAVLTLISWAAFLVGSFVCLLNFYLSWLSHPLHRLQGLSPEAFRSRSGFPLFRPHFCFFVITPPPLRACRSSHRDWFDRNRHRWHSLVLRRTDLSCM